MIADALHVLTEADLALVVPTFALRARTGRWPGRVAGPDYDI